MESQPGQIMDKDLSRYLTKKVDSFKDILKKNNYLYDITQLHDFFECNQQYTPKEIKNQWRQFLLMQKRQNRSPSDIDCYVNIPFCRSKCAYCVYPSRLVKSERQLDHYISGIIEDIDFYADVFSQAALQNLYIGGGTPSILTIRHIKRLTRRLFESFSFVAGGQRTFECNPTSASKEKISLLHDLGFNRISLGVQSLNAVALRINKRGTQSTKEVRRAVREAKQAGFKDINVDLLALIPGDNTKQFRKSFSQVASMAPSNIVLYGLSPPSEAFTEKYYRLPLWKYFKEYYPEMIQNVLDVAIQMCDKFGYSADSYDTGRFHWGFRRKDCLASLPAKTYEGEFGGCMLGIGWFSRSHIRGMMEYRHRGGCFHVTRDKKIYDGRIISNKEMMVRFILHQLCQHSKISNDQFKNIFGTKITQAFPRTIYALKTLKKIIVDDDILYLTLSRVDEKYISALFFLDEAGLIKN